MDKDARVARDDDEPQEEHLKKACREWDEELEEEKRLTRIMEDVQDRR